MTDKTACCLPGTQTHCMEEFSGNTKIVIFALRVPPSISYMLRWFRNTLLHINRFKVLYAKIESVKILCEFVTVITKNRNQLGLCHSTELCSYRKRFLPMMCIVFPIAKSCGEYHCFISSAEASSTAVGKLAMYRERRYSNTG